MIIENELQMHLVNKIPLIALVIATKENLFYPDTLMFLEKRIQNCYFFKVKTLYLDCILEGRLIFSTEKTAITENNSIYYTENWRSPTTLYDLVEELCKFLEVKNIEKELNVLLLTTFEESLKWLQMKKYDITKLS